MTAHLKTPLSSSWSLKTTPHRSTSSRTVTSLLTDRRLRSWLSRAVLTTCSLTHSKLWRWPWTSGESPPPHSPSWTALWLWAHCEKGPAEEVRQLRKFNLPQELLKQCSIRPQHFNNCLVQLSYQIWPQKTMEGSPDCWANHWYNPNPSLQELYYPEWEKGWQNHSGPLTSSTLPLWTVTVWAMLQSSEHPETTRHRNSFFPSSNPSHEHLTINVEHRTLSFIIFHF